MRDLDTKTLVLIWRSLGPYHLARARALAERMRIRGIRVIALELADADETRDWIVDRNNSDLEVVTLLRGHRLSRRSQNAGKQLAEYLDMVRPQQIAVAGYDRLEMRIALRWANDRHAVAILMSETKWDDRRRSWLKRWLTSREVTRVDAAIVSGGAAGEYLITLGIPRERIFRHYGAVDNKFFMAKAAEVRRQPRSAQDPCYFLASARLIEHRKNFKTLLSAYSEYRRGKGDFAWDLVVCGDGPDRAELERFSRASCDGGVRFLGFQQIPELAESYARAACFIHPAVNEAWGLVVNEAMASGLPVLVSRRCGCAYDLVHEGVNGFTFDPHDPSGLAELMLRVSEFTPDRRLQMGRNSQQIVQRFGCDQFALGLEQAISAVSKSRGRASFDLAEPNPDSGNLLAPPDALHSIPSIDEENGFSGDQVKPSPCASILSTSVVKSQQPSLVE